VNGGGSIAASGLFTAGGTAGGPFIVTATSGAVAGTAQVTVSAVAPQPDVTVDFESLSDGASLTSYGGITWGTGGGGWAVWAGGVTWTKVGYVTSAAKTEVTSTFVIPAGMVPVVARGDHRRPGYRQAQFSRQRRERLHRYQRHLQDH
jgi:hypothetical protein